MQQPERNRATLRLAEGDELPGALADALAGGAPVAPLPPTGLEREQTLAMLRPELPPEAGTAVVVATSGSTGHPKGVLLPAAAIRAAAAATHERLGGPGDWVLGLPTHYVAGLMVLARAEIAGTTAVRTRSDLGDLAEVTARLGDRRYLSIVPTQLARALDQPALLAALASFDAVLVGGGPLAEPLAAAAGRAGVAVVTTYGMSETCGGCVYDGVPLGGVEITLEPSAGPGARQEAQGTRPFPEPVEGPEHVGGSEHVGGPEPVEGPQPVEGRISIGGPSLFTGYRLRPDLTAAALRDGRLVTADRGRWAEGRLQVVGRVDEVVVSGGMNVDLAEVQRTVLTWPELGGAEVLVVGVPDREWGTAVVAVVEGELGDGASTRLRAYLSESLPGYAAPRLLVAMTRLPRTSSGKIDRRQAVDALTPPRSPDEEPRA